MCPTKCPNLGFQLLLLLHCQLTACFSMDLGSFLANVACFLLDGECANLVITGTSTI